MPIEVSGDQKQIRRHITRAARGVAIPNQVSDNEWLSSDAVVLYGWNLYLRVPAELWLKLRRKSGTLWNHTLFGRI
jgi:hypothetical protein